MARPGENAVAFASDGFAMLRTSPGKPAAGADHQTGRPSTAPLIVQQRTVIYRLCMAVELGRPGPAQAGPLLSRGPRGSKR